MSELADELATWLFDHVQLPANPPIDVEELARRMGIDAIKTARMFEDGRLEQDGRHATIYLRERLPATRRRFTIAHELGHRLLLHPRAPAQRYRHRLVHDKEERFCDDLAAAMLLPRDWVSTNFATAPCRLATVRHLATGTQTSLSASVVRLHEVVQWNRSLLRFRLIDARWRLDAPAAVPFEIHGQIRTTDATTSVLSDVGARTRADVVAGLPIRVLGRETTITSELSVNGPVAMALLDLRVGHEGLASRRDLPQSSATTTRAAPKSAMGATAARSQRFNALNHDSRRRADSADWADEPTDKALLDGLGITPPTRCPTLPR